MAKSANNSSKDRSSLIVILLLLGAGVLLYKYLGEESASDSPSAARNVASPRGSSIPQSEKYQQSVNRHLMMTNERLEMSRERMAVDNHRLTKEFHETKAQPVYETQNSGLDLDGEGNAKSVAEDLGRGERSRNSVGSPHDVIQTELYMAQQESAYSEAYRKEYARQFIENARRGGYKVELDEDFKVKSVVPLRKPTQAVDLFNGVGKPLQ